MSSLAAALPSAASPTATLLHLRPSLRRP
ncbi:hypothetical protein A2U01_0086156, partial [Trifolium medium]|nr:hypothetical protein [Trifolium medium]